MNSANFNGDLVSILKLNNSNLSSSIRCHTLCKITKVDLAKKILNAKPLVKERIRTPEGHEYIELPELIDIPFLYNGAEPRVGETCICLHTDRTLKGIDINSPNFIDANDDKHMLGDCLAISGFGKYTSPSGSIDIELISHDEPKVTEEGKRYYNSNTRTIYVSNGDSWLSQGEPKTNTIYINKEANRLLIWNTNDLIEVSGSGSSEGDSAKLYNELGYNTDGALTQKKTTEVLELKVEYDEIIDTGNGIVPENKLDDYYTKSESDSTFVSQNYLQSKNYATEDFVKENGGKIDIIKVNGTTQTITNKEVNIAVPSVDGLASESYVDQKVANLIDGAPEKLDTLNELAAALRDNENIVQVLEDAIGNKADKSTLDNYIPQGGTLNKPLKVTGGDSSTSGKIILDSENKGQITNNATGTLFGFTNTTDLTVGHSGYNLKLRGSSDQPTYNGKNLAIDSDLVHKTGEETISGKKILEQGLSSDNSAANIKVSGDGYVDFATNISRGDVFFGYNQNGNNPVSIYNFGNSTGKNGQRQGLIFAGKVSAETELYTSGNIQALGAIKAGTSITKNKVEVATVNDLPKDYVSFEVAQSLTEEQKAQARENIGAGGTSFSGSYKDLLNKPFDVVITSQSEFETMLASSDWLGARSVALVGNGGSLEFVSSDTIEIPQTVLQIQGFNNAIIRISTTNYLTYGIWYKTKPSGTEYSFRDIKILFTYPVNFSIWGVRNLINCTNVTLEIPEQPSSAMYYERTGFFLCDNLINCKCTAPLSAFANCTNVVNCSATTLRDLTYAYGYFECKYGINNVGSDYDCVMWFSRSPNSLPLPLGMIIHSTKKLVNSGLHLADGGELMFGGVYDDFCQYVRYHQDEFPNILYDDGEDIPSEERKTALEKWQEEFATYGQCGYYVITDTYVKLPAITKLTGGLPSTDLDKMASMNEAGLPNITGTVWINSVDSGTVGSGALRTTRTSSGAGGTSYNSGNLTFDASRSNSIYGKSSKVEVEYVKFPYYIVVATVTKTDIEVNIDNVITDLNSKASKHEANNMPSNTYETLTGTNGGTYTAPANGWFCIDATTSSGNAYKMTDFTNNTNGMYIRMQGWGGSARITNIIPVKKGDVVTLGLSSVSITGDDYFRFYYAEGEL